MIAIINWTNVLDSLIFGAPAIIASLAAAIYGRKIHKQIQLPSGKPIGDAMEYTHDTAIANNLLLSRGNSTKTADHKVIEDHGALPPQVPN